MKQGCNRSHRTRWDKQEGRGRGGTGVFYGHRHPMRAENQYLVALPKNTCGLERHYEVRPHLETYLRQYQRGKDTCTHLSTHTRSCFSFPATVQNAEQRWRERPSRMKASYFYFFIFLNQGIESDSYVCLHRLLQSYPSKPHFDVYIFMKPTLDSRKRIKVRRFHIWHPNCSVYDFIWGEKHIHMLICHYLLLSDEYVFNQFASWSPKAKANMQGLEGFRCISCFIRNFLWLVRLCLLVLFFVSSTRTGCTDHFHLFHVILPPSCVLKEWFTLPLQENIHLKLFRIRVYFS